MKWKFVWGEKEGGVSGEGSLWRYISTLAGRGEREERKDKREEKIKG